MIFGRGGIINVLLGLFMLLVVGLFYMIKILFIVAVLVFLMLGKAAQSTYRHFRPKAEGNK